MKLKKSVLYKLNLLSLTKADFKNLTPENNSRKLTIKYKSKELTCYEQGIILSVVCQEFELSLYHFELSLCYNFSANPYNF